mgnify:CR=1 FL=1
MIDVDLIVNQIQENGFCVVKNVISHNKIIEINNIFGSIFFFNYFLKTFFFYFDFNLVSFKV